MTPEGTLDTEQETVVKIFKHNKNSNVHNFFKDQSTQAAKQNQDILYEFGNQNKLLCDLKHETSGLNRRKSETIQEYIDRLTKHDLIGTSYDYSIPEFPPEQMQKFNQMIKTYDNTYYFSYTTGDRNQTR